MKFLKSFSKTIALIYMILVDQFALADNGPQNNNSVGFSPASVEVTLIDDVVDSGYRFQGFDETLGSYYEWKAGLKERNGLDFGMDYNMLYQHADDSLTGEDAGFGGILRLYGTLLLYETSDGAKGSFVFKTENRHNLGDKVVPQVLGGQFGYVGLTGPQFGDSGGWILTNLFWQQRVADERLNFNIGILDPTDYLNVYGLIDPLKSYSNFAFLNGQTIAAPSQGLGAVVGWAPTSNYYLIGGIYDANGDPSAFEDSFDSFFNDSEYFTQFEIGWISSFERRYFENVHLTIWQSDERESLGIDEDKGVSFSATTFIDDHWMPFIRAGYADGTAALFEKEVNIGVGYYFDDVKDVFGVGLGWGEPSKVAFGIGVDDEKVVEIFYRMQLTPEIAVTPDLQVIFDPSQNPSEDRVTVIGVRARLVF